MWQNLHSNSYLSDLNSSVTLVIKPKSTYASSKILDKIYILRYRTPFFDSVDMRLALEFCIFNIHTKKKLDKDHTFIKIDTFLKDVLEACRCVRRRATIFHFCNTPDLTCKATCFLFCWERTGNYFSL